MRRYTMGTVYAEITIKNAGDVFCVKQGLIKEEDIRSITITSKVDTGASELVINEELCEKLGLFVVDERKARVADGRWVFCKLAHGVEIHWKDRYALCGAMVLPGSVNVLLGAVPLEVMDLIVDPGKQELVGRHGDEVVMEV
jgi:clan AA aspartic protease